MALREEVIQSGGLNSIIDNHPKFSKLNTESRARVISAVGDSWQQDLETTTAEKRKDRELVNQSLAALQNAQQTPEQREWGAYTESLKQTLDYEDAEAVREAALAPRPSVTKYEGSTTAADVGGVTEMGKTAWDYAKEVPNSLLRFPFNMSYLASFGYEYLTDIDKNIALAMSPILKKSPDELLKELSSSNERFRDDMKNKVKAMSLDDPEAASFADAALLDFVTGGMLAGIGNAAFKTLSVGTRALSQLKAGGASVVGGKAMEPFIEAIPEMARDKDMSSIEVAATFSGMLVIGAVAGIGLEDVTNILAKNSDAVATAIKIGTKLDNSMKKTGEFALDPVEAVTKDVTRNVPITTPAPTVSAESILKIIQEDPEISTELKSIVKQVVDNRSAKAVETRITEPVNARQLDDLEVAQAVNLKSAPDELKIPSSINKPLENSSADVLETSIMPMARKKQLLDDEISYLEQMLKEVPEDNKVKVEAIENSIAKLTANKREWSKELIPSEAKTATPAMPDRTLRTEILKTDAKLQAEALDKKIRYNKLTPAERGLIWSKLPDGTYKTTPEFESTLGLLRRSSPNGNITPTQMIFAAKRINYARKLKDPPVNADALIIDATVGADGVVNKIEFSPDAGIINGRAIKERYPLAFNLLLTTGKVNNNLNASVRNVSELMDNWTSSLFSHDFVETPKSVMAGKTVKDHTIELHSLWDDVRKTIPQKISHEREIENIQKLQSVGMLNRRQATKFFKFIKENFPNSLSDIDVKLFNSAESPANGTFNVLGKEIALNLDGERLAKTLSHEVGHYNWMYNLKASERVGFIDEVHKAIQENRLEKILPQYTEYKKYIASGTSNISEETFQRWSRNPSEIYAQMVAATVAEGTIPSAKTAGAILKGVEKMSKTFGAFANDLRTVPKEFRKYIVKAEMAKGLRNVLYQIPEDFESAAMSSKIIPPDKEQALLYMEEIDAELRDKYDNIFTSLDEGYDVDRGIKLPQRVSDIVDIDDLFTVSFSSVNAEKAAKVAKMRIEDLPKVLTTHGIKAYLDPDNFDPELVNLALARYKELVTGEHGYTLSERMLLEQSKEIYNKAETQIDVLTGKQALSRAEKFDQKMISEAKDMSRGDIPEESRISMKIKNAIVDALRNASLKKLEAGLARGISTEVDTSGKYVDPRMIETDLTVVEKQEIARKVRNEILQSHEEYKLGQKTLVSRNTELAAEAYKIEMELLNDFVVEGAIAAGKLEVIPSVTLHQLKGAQYAAMALFEEGLGGVALSASWRSVALAYAGLGYDEDGSLTWSTDNMWDSGNTALALLAITGGKPGRWMLKTSRELAAKKMRKLPIKTQQKMNEFFSAIKSQLAEHGGIGRELHMQKKEYERSIIRFRNDFMTMSRILKNTFDDKDRAIISQLVQRETFPGFEEAVKNTSDSMEMFAEIIRGQIDMSKSKLIALGVPREKLNEVTGYLPRVYLDIGKKSSDVKVEKLGAKGVRLDFLKPRGMKHNVENNIGRVAFSGPYVADSTGSLKMLEDSLMDLSAIVDDVKVNSYVKADDDLLGVVSYRYYAPEGSTLDKQFKSDSRMISDNQQWSINKRKGKHIELQRDYTFSERKAFGETLDAAAKMAKYGDNVSKDLAKLESYNKIRNMTDYVANTENMIKKGLSPEVAQARMQYISEDPNYWQVPDKIDKKTGVKVFGDLSGQYVTREVKELLEQMDWRPTWVDKFMEENKWANFYKTGLRAFKINHTVLSIGTHTNNFLSNILHSIYGGDNPVTTIIEGAKMLKARNLEIQLSNALHTGDLKTLTELRKQVSANPDLAERLNIYRKARNLQISDSTMWTDNVSLDDVLKESVKINDALTIKQLQNPELASLSLWKKIYDNSFTSMLGSGLQKGFNVAKSAYEQEDLIFKLGHFYKQVKNGVDDVEALNNAYDIYFDYGSIPKAFKFLRDTGLVPFVSYTYKSYGLVARAWQNNPGKLLLVASALEGIRQGVSANMYGLDNALLGSDAESQALPPEKRRKSLGLFRSQIPLGSGLINNVEGFSRRGTRTLDIGGFLPGANVVTSNPSTSGENQSTLFSSMNTLGAMAGNYFSSSPIIGMITTLATGIESGIGRRIMEENPTNDPTIAWDNFKEFSKYAHKTMAPNLPIVPGTYAFERFMEAVAGFSGVPVMGKTGLTRTGDVIPPMQSLGYVFGIKTSVIDMDEGISRQQKSLVNAYQEAKGRRTKNLRSLAVTPKKKEAEERRFNDISENIGSKLEGLDSIRERALAAKERRQKQKITTLEGLRPGLAF